MEGSEIFCFTKIGSVFLLPTLAQSPVCRTPVDPGPGLPVPGDVAVDFAMMLLVGFWL